MPSHFTMCETKAMVATRVLGELSRPMQINNHEYIILQKLRVLGPSQRDYTLMVSICGSPTQVPLLIYIFSKYISFFLFLN